MDYAFEPRGDAPYRPPTRVMLRRMDFPRPFRHAGQPSPVVVRGRTWTRGEYARFLVREAGYDYDQAAYLSRLPRATVVQVAARPYEPPANARHAA